MNCYNKESLETVESRQLYKLLEKDKLINVWLTSRNHLCIYDCIFKFTRCFGEDAYFKIVGHVCIIIAVHQLL